MKRRCDKTVSRKIGQHRSCGGLGLFYAGDGERRDGCVVVLFECFVCWHR